MELIYLKYLICIFVFCDLDGSWFCMVFMVVYWQFEMEIYWYLNEIFIGYIIQFYSMEFDLFFGKYLLMFVDEEGYWLEQYFEIIVKLE